MSCPLLTRKMLELRGRLPASTRARLVSVSVDPEHDTPEVLRRYAAENGIDGPGWVFLTGGREEVRRLVRDGFHLPGGAALALPSLLVTLLQVTAFVLKLVFFTWLQIVIRWTLPRFRYDQLMRLGWQGLLPLAVANVVVSGLVIVLVGERAA